MRRSPAASVAFFLFLLVNATLFLRPAELVPALKGVPIYEILISAACALSFQRIMMHFSASALFQQPITLCVTGLLAAVVLSHVAHLYLQGALESGTRFLKLLIYYVLLVGLADTPNRLRWLWLSTAVCVTLMVSMCVMDFVGVYDLKSVQHITDREGVDVTGAEKRVMRIRSIGIFQDPNDLSMVIVAAGVLCTYFLTDAAKSPLRFGWLVPIAVLAAALFFTKSRGGLLAAGCAVMTFALARYGRKAAFVVGVLGLCLIPLVAGRQGDIAVGSGTGQDRIQLWREGIVAVTSPDILFGIGQGLYTDVAELVAHNSFVHAYVELGLFGGTLFFGCFLFAALGLYRLSNPSVDVPHPELVRMRPYLAAILAGWCAGMMTLSRCYIEPTYMVAGMAAAYLNLAGMYLRPRRLLVCWDRNHFIQLFAASATLFACFVIFVRVFAR